MPRVPEVLNDRILNQLIRDVRNGLPFMSACYKNRVKFKTFCSWRNKSKNASEKHDRGESLFPAERILYGFEERLQQAKAQFEGSLVEGVYQASEKDWRAGMELLKRRFRDRWGDASTSVNVTQSQSQAQINAPRDAVAEALTNHPDFIEYQRSLLAHNGGFNVPKTIEAQPAVQE